MFVVAMLVEQGYGVVRDAILWAGAGVSFQAEEAIWAGRQMMASRMVPVVALISCGSAISVAAARVRLNAIAA